MPPPPETSRITVPISNFETSFDSPVRELSEKCKFDL